MEDFYRVLQGCLEGVVILTGGCGKAVSSVLHGYPEGVGRVFGKCGEAVWKPWEIVLRVFKGCLESGEALCSVWGRGLSGRCKNTIRRLA